MRFREGKWYSIIFWDHSSGHSEPLKIRVDGWVVKDEPHFIQVSSWEVLTDCEKTKRDNLEPICIMKSCIIKNWADQK